MNELRSELPEVFAVENDLNVEVSLIYIY